MSARIVRRGCCASVGFARDDGRNALDVRLVEELSVALEGALAMDEVRCVVLRSDAAGYFSVGMDLDALRRAGTRPESEHQEAIDRYTGLLRRLVGAPVLSVCVVEGLAVGGGVDLAAACDLTVATERASFCIGQLRKGVFPLTTSAVVAPKIGRSAFLHWALGGQYWSAQRACSHGLVQLVLDTAEVERWLAQLERSLAAADGEALRAGMQLIRAQDEGLRQRIDLAAPFLLRNCARAMTATERSP
jgi:methylglutaconyl-CoA hydratase